MVLEDFLEVGRIPESAGFCYGCDGGVFGEKPASDFLEPYARDCLEYRFMLEFAETQVGEAPGDAEMLHDVLDANVPGRIVVDESERLPREVETGGHWRRRLALDEFECVRNHDAPRLAERGRQGKEGVQLAGCRVPDLSNRRSDAGQGRLQRFTCEIVVVAADEGYVFWNVDFQPGTGLDDVYGTLVAARHDGRGLLKPLKPSFKRASAPCSRRRRTAEGCHVESARRDRPAEALLPQ